MHADAFEASTVTHLQMVETPKAFQASLLLITLAKSKYIKNNKKIAHQIGTENSNLDYFLFVFALFDWMPFLRKESGCPIFRHLSHVRGWL